jgi:hypothetical protein
MAKYYKTKRERNPIPAAAGTFTRRRKKRTK